MKHYIATAFLLLVTISTFAQKKEKIKGNREVTTVIYELDPFTTLEIKEDLEIVLINGTTPQVEVNTDENLHEVFNIDVVNGTLSISTSKEIRSSKKLEIFVTISENLERIHVESDAELKSLTTLNINKAEINAMGDSELDLKIKSDSLAINSYGKAEQRYEIDTNELILTAFENSKVKAKVTATKVTSQVEFANVQLEGKTDSLFLEVKERGEFVTPLFTAKEISVTATEQAKIVINATEKVTIDAHDNSEIDLLGNPTSIIIYKFEEEAVLRKISENRKGFLKRIF
ncbi:GIN domain-containing protein [Kordia sp.]|uniref:GIN domain-containing protein n=1 Tax=Kordia sp. TaxID=1965332 RepID=UPI003D2B270D